MRLGPDSRLRLREHVEVRAAFDLSVQARPWFQNFWYRLQRWPATAARTVGIALRHSDAKAVGGNKCFKL
jgi:hypothetical protein